MIRWKYVLPRLLLCGLVAAFVFLAANPLLRMVIVRSGQAVTGARVDVDRIQTSLGRGHVDLVGFRAADPRRPMRNLFQADRIRLEIDRRALAQRRIVVQRAQIAGFRVGTERTTSGALEPSPAASYGTQLADDFADYGRRWLNDAVRRLTQDVQQELQSVALAEELLGRWPQEMDRIEKQADTLKSRVQQLHRQLEDAGENPLRNAASYQQAIAELAALGNEIGQVRGDVNRIGQQFLMDQEAITTAKAHDLALLKEKMDLPVLNGEDLTEYLLGPEASERITAILDWMQWGRRLLPTVQAHTTALRHRGEDVWFRGLRPAPEVLLETLVLTGTGQRNGRSFNLEGTLRGLASQPQYLDRPTELVIQTSGDNSLSIQAMFDASATERRDRMVIRCEHWPHAARTFGDPRQLAVTLPADEVRLWVLLDLVDDQLSGEVVLKRNAAELDARLGDEFCCTEVADLLKRTVKRISRIEASIALRGTLDHPQWTLRSNLGHELAGGLRDSVRDALWARQEAYVHQAHEGVRQQLTDFQNQLADRQTAVLQNLQVGDTGIQSVKEFIATRVDLPDGLLDEHSPLREMFRR